MWQLLPKNLTLNAAEVHLWRQNLELSPTEVEQGFAILNAEEKAKAKKFHFDKHQRRFIIARSTLKKILGHYLNILPQDIKFDYNSKGKPRLADEFSKNPLQFNLSHSEELAIYGITGDRPIGVDLEYIRPMPDAHQLAKRFFCAKEAEIINNLTSPELEQAFFQLWTAKEAYLKAIGEGISGGLDQVEISLTPSPRFIHLPQAYSDSSPWRLASVIPDFGYQGAVAVQGNDWKLTYWQLTQN